MFPVDHACSPDRVISSTEVGAVDLALAMQFTNPSEDSVTLTIKYTLPRVTTVDITLGASDFGRSLNTNIVNPDEGLTPGKFNPLQEVEQGDNSIGSVCAVA